MSAQSILRLSILLLVSFLALIAAAEEIPFQDLVAGVDPKDIHAALHESVAGKYKHGVFEGDNHALEVVHRSSPTEATRIVQLAKAKRQSNTTITSHNPSISTSTTVLSTRTVTLANGGRSTVTDVTVVGPTGGAEPAVSPVSPSSPATTTTSGKPALQTNEAGRMGVSSVQQMLLAALAVVGGVAAAL